MGFRPVSAPGRAGAWVRGARTAVSGGLKDHVRVGAGEAERADAGEPPRGPAGQAVSCRGIAMRNRSHPMSGSRSRLRAAAGSARAAASAPPSSGWPPPRRSPGSRGWPCSSPGRATARQATCGGRPPRCSRPRWRRRSWRRWPAPRRPGHRTGRPRPGAAPLHHQPLPGGGDRGHGRAAPLLVDAAAPDEGVGPVSVGGGVPQPLEHQHTAALAPDVTVGLGGEREAAAGGGEHLRLVEHGRGERRELEVAGGDDRQVALAEAQRRAGHVGGGQRR